MMSGSGFLPAGTWFINDAKSGPERFPRRGLDRHEAIWLPINFMAIGALRSLRKRGLRSADVAPLLRCYPRRGRVNPFLYSPGATAYTMGTLAMQLLLERISGTVGLSAGIVLSAHLLIRRSAEPNSSRSLLPWIERRMGAIVQGRSPDGSQCVPLHKPAVPSRVRVFPPTAAKGAARVGQGGDYTLHSRYQSPVLMIRQSGSTQLSSCAHAPKSKT
jgi:hypothetical protein